MNDEVDLINFVVNLVQMSVSPQFNRGRDLGGSGNQYARLRVVLEGNLSK